LMSYRATHESVTVHNSSSQLQNVDIVLDLVL
jgi:hypothetical protein